MSTSSCEKWATAITRINRNSIVVRGYGLEELIGSVSFAEAVYLLLKGELPKGHEALMMDAILVSCIDHGLTSPSTRVARIVASAGSPPVSALAAGLLAFTEYHGGAIEGAMHLFHETHEKFLRSEGSSLQEIVRATVRKQRRLGKRIPGFGHQLHTEDPRSRRLIALANEWKLAGTYVEIVETYRAVLAEQMEKAVPLNVDGCIAALLCELGFEPRSANLFFAISRSAGLSAHIQEEQTRERVMRDIDFSSVEYDGPQDRQCPAQKRRGFGSS